jgi:hypothetical protein
MLLNIIQQKSSNLITIQTASCVIPMLGNLFILNRLLLLLWKQIIWIRWNHPLLKNVVMIWLVGHILLYCALWCLLWSKDIRVPLSWWLTKHIILRRLLCVSVHRILLLDIPIIETLLVFWIILLLSSLGLHWLIVWLWEDVCRCS